MNLLIYLLVAAVIGWVAPQVMHDNWIRHPIGDPQPLPWKRASHSLIDSHTFLYPGQLCKTHLAFEILKKENKKNEHYHLFNCWSDRWLRCQ